jgi:hypothetical protein
MGKEREKVRGAEQKRGREGRERKGVEKGKFVRKESETGGRDAESER